MSGHDSHSMVDEVQRNVPADYNGTSYTTPSPNNTEDFTVDENAKYGDEKGRLPTVAGPALEVLQQIQLDDQYHPIHWGSTKRWAILGFYCLLETWTTLTSTAYLGVEFLIQERFGGSTQLLTLGQSMYIVGNALGPAVLGPLSDIGGRKWVYVVSIACFALINIVSCAKNARRVKKEADVCYLLGLRTCAQSSFPHCLPVPIGYSGQCSYRECSWHSGRSFRRF